MIHNESSIVINEDLDKVYEVAEKNENFVELMPHVKMSRVLKREGDKKYTEMTGKVNFITSSWQSVSTAQKNKSIRYTQVKGFCKVMGGEWKFEKVPEGTKITLTHDFDVGWPIIGNLIGKLIVKRWNEKYSDMMLNCLKKYIEGKKAR